MPFNYRQELDELDRRTRRRVTRLYEQADEILQKRVRESLERNLSVPSIDASVNFSERVMREALRKTKPEIEHAVQMSFLAGTNNVNARIKGGALEAAFDALTGAEKEQAAALMQENYLRFAGTLRTVTTATRNVLTRALKRQLREKVALGVLTGDSVQQIARDLRNDVFTPRGITAFVKSNGARMSLGDYSRTLTRTMIIESGTEGSRARMATLSINIFQISEHAGGAEDDACASHQGNIYDLTGKKYPKPKEDDYPPYHPNCRHVINPRPDLQL